MDELTSTTGLVALVACGIALMALGLAAVAVVRLRRVRAGQRVVLGEAGAQDLVGHAASLDTAFRDLHAYVAEAAERLEGRLDAVETRLDGAVAHLGLVRYDAYNEMSGQQSTSIALLDARANGLVLSSIHHRDQARLYVKRVRDGRGELELSPEEADVIRQALEGHPPAAAQAH
ncbi:MAG TPA: DUF4446 family protein [Solirubrobacteraceae bacterium]|nr:DUF4446 family protein [Solirubrobacteraceae bacterium]